MSGLLTMDEVAARLSAQAVPITEVETVALRDAAGRWLARDLMSAIDVPTSDTSAMDGYALRAADIAEGGSRLVVSQRLFAGDRSAPLQPGTAARIFTGAGLPPGADCVVMQEAAREEDGQVSIDERPEPGQFVRRRGEDIARGAVVLTAGTRLDARHLGLCASIGLAGVPVWRRLRVALLCSGDELHPPGSVLPDGGVYNSNRDLIAALLDTLQMEVLDLGVVRDEPEAVRDALSAAAAAADVIVCCGGVSVGEADHVRAVVEAIGRLDLWRVAIKPGKPLAFGRIAQTDFFGLPGNPVSAFVTFVLLVRPFLEQRQGGVFRGPESTSLRADFDWPSVTRDGAERTESRREFLRARRNPAGGLDLFPNQGSATLASLSWADGLVDNPPGKRIRAGDTVRFLPWSALC